MSFKKHAYINAILILIQVKIRWSACIDKAVWWGENGNCPSQTKNTPLSDQNRKYLYKGTWEWESVKQTDLQYRQSAEWLSIQIRNGAEVA